MTPVIRPSPISSIEAMNTQSIHGLTVGPAWVMWKPVAVWIASANGPFTAKPIAPAVGDAPWIHAASPKNAIFTVSPASFTTRPVLKPSAKALSRNAHRNVKPSSIRSAPIVRWSPRVWTGSRCSISGIVPVIVVSIVSTSLTSEVFVGHRMAADRMTKEGRRARSARDLPGSADGAGRGGVTGEVGGCFCAPGDLELGEDARDVVLDRLLGQGQVVADLLVGLAVGDLLQDPFLLGRQTCELLVAISCLPRRRRSSTAVVMLGSSSESPAPTARIACSRSFD